MALNFSNKTAIVTGASRGIGLAIATYLSECGCRVAINGRNKEELSLVSTKISGSQPFPADVTNPVEAMQLVAEVVKHYGRLDILVCNVGSGNSVAPGAETYEEWRRVFDLNLWSATNMVEASRDALSITKGSIVCISSICGLGFVPGAPLTYAAAKAALNSYIRGAARPLGKLGIRINGVAPGNILFPGSSWEGKVFKQPDGVSEFLEREVPLNRFGNPLEVAELVGFLLSDKARFATGAIWTLDGGQSHV